MQDGAAPAMVLLLWVDGQARVWSAGGADPDTVFDLASLTKPLSTAFLLLDLAAKEVLSWQAGLGDLWGDAVPEDKKAITIRQLMTHSSGLPAYQPYYTLMLKNPPALRQGLVKAMLMNEPLLNPPGTKTVYSDLGYMLLGLIIEQALGTGLDKVLARLYGALDIEGPVYLPLEQDPPWPQQRIAPCGPLPGRPVIHGEVEDENAHAMGGVAPHAGLFGSAAMVAAVMDRLARAWRGEGPWDKQQVRLLCELDHTVPGSSRTPGFDTPTGPGSAAGDHPPQGTVGHLGFTGTSLWWHMPSNRGVVLLSNRVAHGRENQKIKPLRNQVHNLAWKELMRP